MFVLWMACTTTLRVNTNVPEATVGVVQSTYPPPTDDLRADFRDVGRLEAKVEYHSLQTWWMWAEAEGYETVVTQIPKKVAAGHAVLCGTGFLLFVPLASCFFASKPTNREVTITLQPVERKPADPPMTKLEPVTTD